MNRTLRKIIRPSSHLLNRRTVVRGALLSAGLAAAPAIIGRASAQPEQWTYELFSLGVASGAPTPSGFVLWTRIAPEPLSLDPEPPAA
jgi:alkaline phosphatase D